MFSIRLIAHQTKWTEASAQITSNTNYLDISKNTNKLLAFQYKIEHTVDKTLISEFGVAD